MIVFLVSLFWFVYLPSCARPAGVERDINVQSENSTFGGSHCEKDEPQKTIKARCVMPGGKRRQPITCTGCSFIYRDTHDICLVKCCDTTRDDDNTCRCTPYGSKYDYSSEFDNAVGANTPDKCCGTDKKTRAKTLPGKICGCTDVGMFLNQEHGATESDCCSGKAVSGTCEKGDCAKKGKSGQCCRAARETDRRQHKESCPCFHAGEAPNPNDDVSWENCCSGKINDAGNGCACLNDPKEQVPAGVEAIDCCSGKLTENRQHCVASDCSVVGATVTGGQHCCSGRKDGDKCQCVASGHAIPDGATAHDCCSGRLDEDKKCGFLDVGEAVPNNTKAEDVCMSGSVYFGLVPWSSYCRCILAGQQATNETHCCSGVADGGKCSCVGVDHAFGMGGTVESCCSGYAEKGTCQCAPPGAPVPQGNVGACCSGKAGGDGRYCGCFNHLDKVNSEAEGAHCCGGPFNYDKLNSKCLCLKPGHAVGSWATSDACCDSKMDSLQCTSSD